MISIQEAINQQVQCLRSENWANLLDHIRLDFMPNGVGPWIHFYSPMNRPLNARDPVDILFTEFDRFEDRWEPYTGPVAESDEYKAACANAQALFAKSTEQ